MLKVKNPVVKKITKFRPMILSRHPTHSALREQLVLMPFRSVVRLGSTTDVEDDVTHGGKRLEINTVESIKNSSNKLRMKECFMMAGVKTAQWWDSLDKLKAEDAIPFPIVAKHHYGSRGKGNTLIQNQAELDEWVKGKTPSNYIFEKFYNYAHEFRLHISADGCFYTCRKALKQDVPEKEKWHFHDETCVWFMEENEKFFKPNSWDNIVSDCVKALASIGADVLAFDVKVQSPKDKKGNLRESADYILIECNSAASHGDVTREKYLESLPKIMQRKYELSNKI